MTRGHVTLRIRPPTEVFLEALGFHAALAGPPAWSVREWPLHGAALASAAVRPHAVLRHVDRIEGTQRALLGIPECRLERSL